MEGILKDIFQRFPAFHKWAEDKKAGAEGLSVLLELSDPLKARDLLNWIGRNRPGHSRGIQIIETAGELLLMGKDLAPVFKAAKTPEELLKKLLRLRRPEATKRDEERARRISSLPWPAGVQGRPLRQNDTAGLEVRFTCFSLKDFKRKVQSLDLVCERLKKEDLFHAEL